jgi:hypothetical protein
MSATAKTTPPRAESGEFTTSASEIAPPGAQPEPEFIGLPSPGRACPYSGLKRGSFYSLIAEGKIKSFVLHRNGAARGRRLVSYRSLMDHLKRLEQEQCASIRADQSAEGSGKQ